MSDIVSKQKYSFPKEQQYSKKYLRENYWKCNYTSAGYQYWLILPKNVKSIKIESIIFTDLKLTNIGQYITTDNSPYLEVLVAYEHCIYEINAMDWLLKKLTIMGEYILHYREIEGKSTGKYLDVLTYKKLPSGDEFISRFTVIKDYDKSNSGANYFFIKASCFEKNYQEMAFDLLQVVCNWDLINKSNWQMAENLFPFKFQFVEDINFFVPVSWEIFIEDSDPNCMRFLFKHDEGDKNIGIINSYFYSDTNLEQQEIYEKTFNRFKKLSGFKGDMDKLEVLPKKNPNIVRLCYTQGEIEYKEENFQAYLMIYIIKTFKGWYYFESIGSKPNLQNYNWEASKRCLELIVNSFNNLGFEGISNVKEIGNNKITEVYKTHKGKNYTQEEWKQFEEEQFKIYAKKHNLSIDKKEEPQANKKYPPSRFLD